MAATFNWHEDIYIYISLVKVRFVNTLQKSGEAYKQMQTMHILVFMSSKFYDRSIGEVGLWFGGQFRELESPKVWLMVEIFIFEGQKHAKSLQLIKRFPAMFSEISYLISA